MDKPTFRFTVETPDGPMVLTEETVTEDDIGLLREAYRWAILEYGKAKPDPMIKAWLTYKGNLATWERWRYENPEG